MVWRSGERIQDFPPLGDLRSFWGGWCGAHKVGNSQGWLAGRLQAVVGKMPVPHRGNSHADLGVGRACRGHPAGLLQRRDAGTLPRAGMARRERRAPLNAAAGEPAGQPGRAAAQWPPGARGPGLPAGPAPRQAQSGGRDPRSAGAQHDVTSH